jgi:hypothetical protein
VVLKTITSFATTRLIDPPADDDEEEEEEEDKAAPSTEHASRARWLPLVVLPPEAPSLRD